MAAQRKVWLPFDNSATYDKCGLTWTAYGNPVVSETNAITGKALQLDGASYLESAAIELGGQDFTVSGWCYTDANCGASARVFNIQSAINANYSLVHLRHSDGSSNLWRLSVNASAAVSSSSTNTADSGIDPTGERHHFEVVYHYANKTMTFFVDGVQKAQRTSCPQYTRQNFIVKVGAYSASQYLFTGAVDEFMIYDGIALHTANFTPPTAADYAIDYQANIKPAVYLSWVPLGKVNIKPLVLATYIAGSNLPTKINGDLQRAVRATESATGDLCLSVTKSETPSSDLLRQINTTETTGGDTCRLVKAEEQISADTRLSITRAESLEADTFREVQRAEKILADTSRRIADTGVTKIYGDVARQIKATETAHGDTNRQVEAEEIISADTRLSTRRLENTEADTYRVVRRVENVFADTLRKVVGNNSTIIYGDLLRQIKATETTNGDTRRQVKAEEKIFTDTSRRITSQEKFSADTARVVAQHETVSADTLLQTATSEKVAAEVLLRLRHFARCDTERKTVTLQNSKADTIIRIPYILKYYRKQNPPRLMQARGMVKANALRAADFFDEEAIVNTFEYYGVTRVSITLSEKTLSDVFEIEFVRARGVDVPDIGETVEFQLLDYTFTFVVEERSETQTRITIKGKYDSTYLLNTQFNLSAIINELAETEEAETASTDDDDEGKDETGDYTGGNNTSGSSTVSVSVHALLEKIAEDLELYTDFAFDDFKISADTFGKITAITYRDVLSNLFGWSSQVPTILVNVFIREGTLHVVQRGQESDNFYLQDCQLADWRKNKQKLEQIETSRDEDTEDEDEEQVPFSGTLSFATTGVHISCTYSKGLLVSEHLSTTSNNTEGDVAGLTSGLGLEPLEDMKGYIGDDKVHQTSNTQYTYLTKTTVTEKNTDEEIDDSPIKIDGMTFVQTSGNTFTRVADENGDYTSEDTDEDEGDEAKEAEEEINSTEEIASHYLSIKSSTTCSTNVAGDYLHTVISKATVNYFYNGAGEDVYLYHEQDITYTEDRYDYMYRIYTNTVKSRVKKTETRRDTYHFPLGNGFYVQAVYVDGNFQGGNISQGKPGNAVSLYTVNQVQQNLTDGYATKTADSTSAGGTAQAKTTGDIKTLLQRLIDSTLTGKDDNKLGDDYTDWVLSTTLSDIWNKGLQPYVDAFSAIGKAVKETPEGMDAEGAIKLCLKNLGIDPTEFNIETPKVEVGATVTMGGAFSVLTGGDDDSRKLYQKCLEQKIALSNATQTTYSCDLVSPIRNGFPTVDHIIDFTDKGNSNLIFDALGDKITLTDDGDDEELFLVSNKITFTPKKLIQSLVLRKWEAAS